MEFWGVEVKAGEPFKVYTGIEKLIHLSQASLGESKKDKGNNSVPLFLKIDDQKLVLGTLSQENYPQISFDLVFEKDFELSHNWKNGSVYFCGYKTDIPEEDDFSDDGSDSEEERNFARRIAENGKPDPKIEQAKPATAKVNATKPESSAKSKVKLVEPNKDHTSDEDDSDGSSEDDTSDDSSTGDEADDEVMPDIDDEDDEGTDDEETPKKAEVGKKRPTESATKTPLPSKKAKVATPEKTDSKKGGGHTATPHPSKKGGKTPAATNDKSKAETPKSSGQVSCKTCSKTFNSDAGLQSHTKAKHSGGK